LSEKVQSLSLPDEQGRFLVIGENLKPVGLTHPDMDAIIIFHHEWESLRIASLSFKQYYPEGKLLIARDTLPVEKRPFLDSLGAHYLRSYSTTQFFIDLNEAGRKLSSVTDEEFIGKIKQDIYRLAEACSLSTSDYLICMEADSLVTGRVEVNPRFHMDTLIANPYKRNFRRLVSRLSGEKFQVKGWGFVTGYVRRDALLRSLDWARENSDVLVQLFNEDQRFLYLDHFLPVLFHLSGEPIFNSGKVGECLRDPNWESKDYALLHQYRKNYQFDSKA